MIEREVEGIENSRSSAATSGRSWRTGSRDSASVGQGGTTPWRAGMRCIDERRVALVYIGLLDSMVIERGACGAAALLRVALVYIGAFDDRTASGDRTACGDSCRLIERGACGESTACGESRSAASSLVLLLERDVDGTEGSPCASCCSGWSWRIAMRVELTCAAPELLDSTFSERSACGGSETLTD